MTFFQQNVKYLDLYANLVVKNTLLSMQDEENGATELFPRLLQIIEIYPSSQKPFTELVSLFFFNYRNGTCGKLP